MLVLSRKVGEKILIGDSISVTVVRISGGGVRIGIEAPADLPVVREELSKNSETGTEKSAVIHQDHITSTNGNGSFDGETPKQPRW